VIRDVPDTGTTLADAMGQPVTVIEVPSSQPGVVRYRTNRPLTGMGHEIYRSMADVDAAPDKPASRIGRILIEQGGVESVHLNGNVITVQLGHAGSDTGFKQLIEEVFIYYRPGVEVVIPEGFGD
jgi:hypothetical protein